MTPDQAVLAGAGLGLIAAAAALGYVLCALAVRWAPRLGFLDRPGGHKAHARPTPLGGGVAIWLTVVTVIGLGALTAWAARPWLPEAITRYASGAAARLGELGVILGLASAVMVMGLIDD